MVGAGELIRRARQAGLSLILEDDNLWVQPASRLEVELARELREARDDLIHLLRLAADGRDILSALSDRGVTVWLGADGRPRARPAHLVGEADRALLVEHRDAILAALAAPEPDSDAAQEPEPEPWHSPCSVCGSGGSCRSRVPQPDGGWACQEALDRGLIEPGRPSRFRRRT